MFSLCHNNHKWCHSAILVVLNGGVKRLVAYNYFFGVMSDKVMQDKINRSKNMAVEPVRITIRIPPDLHAAITTQATKRDSSINQQIVDSLYAGLGVEPKPQQTDDMTRAVLSVLESSGVDVEVLAALTAAMTEDPERRVLSEAELNDMVDKRLFHHGIARLREPT